MATESLLTPVGRLVSGSLYRGDTTNYEGEPLVYKTGPDAGKTRTVYFIALAIAKGAETHWNQTEWGAKIWNVGVKANPNAERSPTFSWKITDGDDTSEFDTKGNPRKVRICDREGHAGHWILKLSSSFIKTLIYNHTSKEAKETTQEGAINLGDYVQVFLNVSYNNSATPGVYLNPVGVCLMGYGERIVSGIDLTTVGFGGALPAGASTTPIGLTQVPTEMAAPSTIASTASTNSVAPAPINVTPYTAILTPPPTSALMPTPVTAPPVRTLHAHPQYNPTGSFTYDQMIASGWTDVQLKQFGMLV